MTLKQRKILILKILLLIAIDIILVLNVFPQFKNIEFDHVNIDNGLSHNAVTSIMQDSEGFLWFGTYDGLNRYDGYEFKIYKYDPNNLASLSSNTVFAVCEVDDSTIWAGTFGGGLNEFNKYTETFRQYKYEEDNSTSLSDNRVYQLFKDKKGKLWICTKGGGLNLLNTKTKQFTHFRNDPDNPFSISSDVVLSVSEDAKGNLWVGTNNGLNRFDTAENKFYRYFLDNNLLNSSSQWFNKIYIDRRGKFWIGSGDGLFNFDEESGKFYRWPVNHKGLSDLRIRDIFEDPYGNFWVATFNKGLFNFDLQTGNYSQYLANSFISGAISSDLTYTLYLDRSDILWIGTIGGGLNKVDYIKTNFSHYAKSYISNEGLTDNYITSIYEDRSGIIWIGTIGGLNRFDIENDRNHFDHYLHDDNNPTTIIDNFVRYIFEDSYHQLWVGTEYGLDRLDRKTGKFIHYQPDADNIFSINDNCIFCIYEDSKRNLWFGTYNRGLNKYDQKTGRFTHFTKNLSDSLSLNDNTIRSICEDNYGYLWIGTESGGINRFDPQTGNFTHFMNVADDLSSLSENKVLKVFLDKENTIWVGTTSGLNKMIPATKENSKIKFQRFMVEDGLPSNAIAGIIEDDKGYLWIITNKGLSKFDSKKNTFIKFDKRDGLQSDEFLENSYAKRKKTGELIFGGLNGFNIFHPDSIRYNQKIPPVVFTNFKIFNEHVPISSNKESPLNQSITFTKSITLSYKQKIFSLEFAALHYASPENNLYKYMLEGFENKWNYVNASRRFVSYTNLNPGEYTFHIMGANKDGLWNEKETSIKIIIEPPFWKTLWFRIASIILLIAAVYGFFSYRVAAVKNRNKALSKLVEERTSEITDKNNILITQTTELNETNTLLEERQQQIEEQSEELMVQKEEISEQNERLKEAFSQVQELNGMKDKLFSIIGHDLKNPINVIMGFSELLLNRMDKLPDEKKITYLSAIYNASINTYNLLENLLDWARSQSGRYPFKAENFDLYSLIQANIILLNEQYKKKEIKVESGVNEGTEVFADKNMIDTVIRNLISNAIKFTPEKGEISISGNISDNNGFVTVSLSDTGVGIPKEKMDSLFRIEKSKSTQGTAGETGTGLGLLLCHEFINKNGGSIWVDSEVSKGSTFTFTIPKSRAFSSDSTGRIK